jgi:hypothetical protein
MGPASRGICLLSVICHKEHAAILGYDLRRKLRGEVIITNQTLITSQNPAYTVVTSP